MSSEHVVGQKDSVDGQADEQTAVDTPELRPTVELESQAKVGTNHPDSKPDGMTLAGEERFLAREEEITRMRLDDRQDSDREVRTRQVALEGSTKRRAEFQTRAASVDGRHDPDRPDPREQLPAEKLATVNREAARLADEVRGRSRVALARRLAERMADGDGPVAAVVAVVEEAKTARGTIVPIGELNGVYRADVSVEGTVETLWDPSHPAIQQVGLVGDETGRVKFTVWKKSDQPMVEEGEQVRIQGAKKNQYKGRASIAVTGWTWIGFPDE